MTRCSNCGQRPRRDANLDWWGRAQQRRDAFARSERRGEREGVAQLIEWKRPELFITLTLPHREIWKDKVLVEKVPIHNPYLMVKLLERFTKEVGIQAYGKNRWKRHRSCRMWCIYSLEYQKGEGGVHAHVALFNARNQLRYLDYVATWRNVVLDSFNERSWRVTGNRQRVQVDVRPFAPDEGGGWYVAKYIAKETENGETWGIVGAPYVATSTVTRAGSDVPSGGPIRRAM